jgi:apolipoprotein N-acyltransferase
LLVSSADEGARDLVEALRVRRSDRIVALQMRRWLVRSGTLGAHVVSPRGEVIVEVKAGLEGAGMAEVAILEETTPYVRGGWWLEISTGVGALAIIGASLAGCVVARRRAHRRAYRQ